MQQPISKRTFLKTLAVAPLMPKSARTAAQQQAPRGGPPNIVLICADDLGYGDLGCYGSGIPTPNLDRMAAEGMRFEHCYSASPVCSPARAALLTGRYPTRTGVPRVLFPSDETGLAESETTIADVLKGQGYRTACVGKWHLGSRAPYLPADAGFDEYFGIPYSNDMAPRRILKNSEVLEEAPDPGTLEERYADEAVRFIGRAKATPFFLYVAPHAPHIPLVRGARPQVRSGLGPYGDMVAGLDWTAGAILGALAHHGLEQDTLVIFTSDNGPWYQGSTGRLRGRKGSTYEGGMRVPFIVRFPGRIPASTVAAGVASLMDLLPTVARLANAPPPPNPLDGVDIWPLLAGEAVEVQREPLLYFDGWHLQCARAGAFKLHVSRYNSPPWIAAPACGRINLPLSRPELYRLDADPGETCDIAPDEPQVVADIRQRIESVLGTFPPEVVNAWHDTMNRAVEDTPVGAMPEPKRA